MNTEKKIKDKNTKNFDKAENLLKKIKNAGGGWKCLKRKPPRKKLKPQVEMSQPNIHYNVEVKQCQDELSWGESAKLPCGHCYHANCIVTWLAPGSPGYSNRYSSSYRILNM